MDIDTNLNHHTLCHEREDELLLALKACVEALESVKALLSPSGDYRVARADEQPMLLPDQMNVGEVFAGCDQSLAKAREVLK